MSLGGGENIDDNEDGHPDLVHQEESQEYGEIYFAGKLLVDKSERDGGADGEGKRADGRHANKHLQDELVGA